MYETFYRLSTNPFRLTPDSNFCFAHASHKEAHAYLEYALKLGEGFIMVTGRPGTGKTTLIESFVRGVDITAVTAAAVAANNLEVMDLLRSVAYVFGIAAEGLDKATLRLRLEQYFIGEQHSGRRVLLFIDEAQGLGHAALEELRLLADLQAGDRPLLQVFLVGQDSLRSLMSAPDMEQLQQRVIGTCSLEPLSLTDTRGYVEYRLRQAGWKGDPEITGAGIVAIHAHSRGVPRHINKTCTRLLLHGVMERKHILDEADVLSIAADLRDEQLGPMEYNTAECPDAVAHMPMPELDDGSVSLAELDLRADPEEVQRAPAITPTGQSPVQAKLSAGWWPDIVTRRHALQQDSIALAHSVAGRWQVADRSRLALGAAMVVALCLAAVLARTPQNDGSEHSVNLATQAGLAETRPAPLPVTQNPDAVQIASESVRDSPQPAPAARRVDENDRRVPEAPEAREGGSELILLSVVVDSHAVVKDSGVETHSVPRREALELAALEQTPHVLPAEQGVSEVAPLSVPAAPVEVRPAPVPAPREQKISKLVSLARQALKEDRLLMPPGNSAYHYYREVLTLQPGNRVAGDGIEAIIQRYMRYAIRALERSDDDKARLFIQRGLRIRPQDQRLLALQERADNRKLMLEAAPKPALMQPVVNTPPAEPVTTAVPEPVQESKNFLLRLKAVFTSAERPVGHEKRRRGIGVKR